jgi:hypothetical protein
MKDGMRLQHRQSPHLRRREQAADIAAAAAAAAAGRHYVPRINLLCWRSTCLSCQGFCLVVFMAALIVSPQGQTALLARARAQQKCSAHTHNTNSERTQLSFDYSTHPTHSRFFASLTNAFLTLLHCATIGEAPFFVLFNRYGCKIHVVDRGGALYRRPL